MRWSRRLFKSRFALRILAFLAAQYIRLVFVTCKWDIVGRDTLEAYVKAKKPLIACFWHGRLSMLVYAWPWKNQPFHMLLSNHRDGRLIGQVISYFGIAPIWGSTQRG